MSPPPPPEGGGVLREKKVTSMYNNIVNNTVIHGVLWTNMTAMLMYNPVAKAASTCVSTTVCMSSPLKNGETIDIYFPRPGPLQKLNAVFKDTSCLH